MSECPKCGAAVVLPKFEVATWGDNERLMDKRNDEREKRNQYACGTRQLKTGKIVQIGYGCLERQLAQARETFSMERGRLLDENERLQKARECSDEGNELIIAEFRRQLAKAVERAEKAEKDRNQMMLEQDDLQCRVASAFGWDCGGVEFSRLVRGYVMAHEIERDEVRRLSGFTLDAIAQIETWRERTDKAETILKAARFCGAHEPIPSQPETGCPMCEAVHQADLREQAEGEVKRLRAEMMRAMRVLGCPSSMATPPEEVPLAQSILEDALDATEKTRAEKAEAEVERVMKANGFYYGRAEKAEAKVKRLREVLLLILPLAKGYAAAHPVGSNQKYIEEAEALAAKEACDGEA